MFSIFDSNGIHECTVSANRLKQILLQPESRSFRATTGPFRSFLNARLQPIASTVYSCITGSEAADGEALLDVNVNARTLPEGFNSFSEVVQHLRQSSAAEYESFFKADVTSRLKQELINRVLYEDIKAMLSPASREFLACCLSTLEASPHELVNGCILPVLAIERLNDFQLEIVAKLVLNLDATRLRQVVTGVSWDHCSLDLLLKSLKKRVDLNTEEVAALVTQLQNLPESRILVMVFFTLAKFHSSRFDAKCRSILIERCQSCTTNRVMNNAVVKLVNQKRLHD